MLYNRAKYLKTSTEFSEDKSVIQQNTDIVQNKNETNTVFKTSLEQLYPQKIETGKHDISREGRPELY